jgi:hypothetical protein
LLVRLTCRAISTRIWATAALLSAGTAGCEGRTWDCAQFAPPASARETAGLFRVHYVGGIGELEREGMPMFVETQTERAVYLSGCTNDEDGMWDVDVVSIVPEDLELPAMFGSEDSTPTLAVRLYRYREDEAMQPALFDDKNLAEVVGTLDALDTSMGKLELDAMLDKPCAGDCSAERSHVDVEARLTW